MAEFEGLQGESSVMCHGEEPGAKAEGVSNHRTKQEAFCEISVVLRDDFVATKSPQDDTCLSFDY